MKVRSAMTTGVVTAAKSDSVHSAVEKMLMRHCGAIPVIERDRTIVGIVTIRDVMLPMYPNYGDYIHDNIHSRDFEEMEKQYPQILLQQVGEIMTSNPLTVSPDDELLKAASFMGLKNLRRIPVAEGGKLLGIISLGDINRALFFSQVDQWLEEHAHAH